ncbi:MAG TPA: SPOR domain-containing protein [Janthinobacterium sp.]|jgi:hypothetical protein|nr:SPOR domain-containing protein [Janthinobacterium sp.]
MLKLTFWCLFAVNVVLFALGKGYLGSLGGDAREPGRLKNQLNADKISLISPARASAEAADSAAAAGAAAAPRRLIACTEIGNFVLADARRFEARVADLELGDRQARHNAPGQEISSYIVHIPPQGSKEGADKKTAELKQLGVTNYFVISDNTALRWAISLGVFKTEAAAQTLLASLLKQGVHSARVSPRYAPSKQFAYQFRDLDGPTKSRLDQIKADFPEQDMHGCK